MVKTSVLIGFVASLLFVSLIAYSLPVSAQGPDSAPGKPEVIGVTGFVPGKNLTVHILVLVHPGEDKNEVAAAALASQGARPFTAEEYSLTGLVWNQFSDSTTNPSVEQFYNTANAPSGAGDETILKLTHDSWTNVEASIFKFSYGGETTNCPSLVKECQGRQQYDSQNDVAWMDLRDKDTLAVTWSGTSSITGPEADVAMNTKFTWDTIIIHEEKVFDIETVLLHELGHVAGVGHSTISDTIMYPSYTKPNRELQQDDKNAISSKYPQPQIGNTPIVSIDSPTETTFANNELIIFSATVTDEDENLAASVDWNSDKGVFLGTGASINVNYLTNDAVHTITASVTDSHGNSSSDSITITVGTITPGNINSKIEFATDVKKRFNNLLITVSATDVDGNSVSNVSVQLTLERDGGGPWNFGGSTDETGSVTFKLMKARSDVEYTATITNWDFVFDGGELDDCAYINSENIAVTCSP